MEDNSIAEPMAPNSLGLSGIGTWDSILATSDSALPAECKKYTHTESAIFRSLVIDEVSFCNPNLVTRK